MREDFGESKEPEDAGDNNQQNHSSSEILKALAGGYHSITEGHFVSVSVVPAVLFQVLPPGLGHFVQKEDIIIHTLQEKGGKYHNVGELHQLQTFLQHHAEETVALMVPVDAREEFVQIRHMVEFRGSVMVGRYGKGYVTSMLVRNRGHRRTRRVIVDWRGCIHMLVASDLLHFCPHRQGHMKIFLQYSTSWFEVLQFKDFI
jgi:hypothetical protein